jgi:hypothetical protein
MKKLLLTIVSLNVFYLVGNIIPAIAAQPCAEDDANPPTKQLPIVRDRADLQRLSGKEVTLFGRYQREISSQPEMMSPTEFMTEVPGGIVPIDPKIDPMNVPKIPRTSGFANIVLEDGSIVRISPMGRRSLRSESELVKYDARSVRVQGTVSWWGKTAIYPSGIDIHQLRFACGVAKPQPMTPAKPMNLTTNNVSVADLNQQQPIGQLGHPLGKIMTISGIIRQGELSAKSPVHLVLSVEAANDSPLAQPVTIEFNLFMTAQVAKPLFGQSFKYVGYETGGFTGVPAEAFKYLPAIATTSHQFNTSFQVLDEKLDIVKTKSDLIRYDDRRVKIIGRYVSHSRKAPAENTGIIGFKGTYLTANIRLEDGTEIPVFPTYNKMSLRSTQEAKAYEGKTITVVGKIQIDRDRTLNPHQRSTFVSIDGIW